MSDISSGAFTSPRHPTPPDTMDQQFNHNHNHNHNQSYAEPPTTPAAASAPAPSSDNANNSSPPKYVPQFSAATEMILKRINSGAGTSNLSSLGITGTPSGYEDMRRSVMMGMKTSMNMELPAIPVKFGSRIGEGSKGKGSKRGSVGSSASATGTPRGIATSTPPASLSKQNKNGTPGTAGRGRKPRAKAGTKRKRKNESSDEESPSESDDVMSKLGGDDSDSDVSEKMDFPKVTQSGRQVNKPAQFVPEVKETSARKRGPSRKALEQTLCKRCGRGHSPSNNQIVFCDGCNAGWHQMCHDPPVSDEAVQDADASWFCAECTAKQNNKSKSTSAKSSQNVSRNASAAAPSPPPLISWQDRSLEDVSFTSPPPHILKSKEARLKY
jgi:hypothetical protein